MKFAIIRVLPFLNNPKGLDPSYKTDLDFWDCFGRKKILHLITEEIQYLSLRGIQIIIIMGNSAGPDEITHFVTSDRYLQ